MFSILVVVVVAQKFIVCCVLAQLNLLYRLSQVFSTGVPRQIVIGKKNIVF
jgi:hypothetical protein